MRETLVMALLDDEAIAAWLPGTTAQRHVMLADVVARYGEPTRRYHDIEHVRTVVWRVVALLADDRVGDVSNPETVVWAALWHDAVYDARSSTNEAESAALARAVLSSAGVDPARIAEVERLITLTADHQVAEDDVAGAVLVDADLAVLGAEPASYARYVAAVREEYDFVPEDAWRTGRTAVLGRLLDLPRIFITAPMRSRNDVARANLTTERDSLS
jgi:predicted metal-dependent HD superfamily phosphohydrolase